MVTQFGCGVELLGASDAQTIKMILRDSTPCSDTILVALQRLA